MTFGEHIRQWREEHGIGLRQFAKAAGVSPTFVSKMERGLGPLPGEETIRNMAMRMNEIMQRFSSLQKEMQLVEQQAWKKAGMAAGA